MQYKQVNRILIEIIQTPNVPSEIILAATRILCRHVLPKLGPYPKRSALQSLWRVASGSAQSSEVRLKALRGLLAVPRGGEMRK